MLLTATILYTDCLFTNFRLRQQALAARPVAHVHRQLLDAARVCSAFMVASSCGLLQEGIAAALAVGASPVKLSESAAGDCLFQGINPQIRFRMFHSDIVFPAWP